MTIKLEMNKTTSKLKVGHTQPSTSKYFSFKHLSNICYI